MRLDGVGGTSPLKVSLCALVTSLQYFRGGNVLDLRSTLFLRFRFLRAARLLGVQSQSHVPRQIYQDPGHLYRSQFLEHGPEIDRRPGSDEIARAYEAARRVGLWRFDQRGAG